MSEDICSKTSQTPTNGQKGSQANSQQEEGGMAAMLTSKYLGHVNLLVGVEGHSVGQVVPSNVSTSNFVMKHNFWVSLPRDGIECTFVD